MGLWKSGQCRVHLILRRLAIDAVPHQHAVHPAKTSRAADQELLNLNGKDRSSEKNDVGQDKALNG